VRLNAFLARAGVASRRGADALIDEGRVAVNREVAPVGTVVGEDDAVTLDGVPLAPQAPAYVVLHKPAGTITTARDPQGRPTVVELVERKERLFPVGRLDADTTGALLLTNDGALAHRLAHPSFGVEKTYVATVSGMPGAAALRQLRDGVELDDGPTAPARARLLGTDAGDEPTATVELVLHEGRNYQVKRMLAAVGHPVIGLHRSCYASITADALEPGEWRELTGEELEALMRLTGAED
jgi:23S rRNA pseudouridine2605 synthase